MNNVRIIHVAFLSVAICTFLFGHSLAGEISLADQRLAVVDGSAITIDDFKEEMKKRGGSFSGSYARAAQRDLLLTEMIRSEMLFIAAKKAGYDRKPEILETLKKIIINQYREEMLGPELANLAVTDAEIEAYYKEHPVELATPAMAKAAVIKITLPAKASAEKKAELARLAETARAEALKLGTATLSFGAVAVKYSDDQASRYRGGDAGWIKKAAYEGRWDKDVMDAVFALKKPGQISPVISADTGFYIVKLMETKESEVRPLPEVREYIRHRVLNDKKVRVEEDFFDKLAEELKVSANRDLLRDIEAPNAGANTRPPVLPGR